MPACSARIIQGSHFIANNYQNFASAICPALLSAGLVLEENELLKAQETELRETLASREQDHLAQIGR
jgi:hypothetical protein